MSVIAYTCAIGISEVVVATVSPFTGALADAIIIVFLVFNSAISKEPAYQRVLQALILLPLMRILSLTMAIQELNPLYWNALIGVPLLVAVILLIRLLGLSVQEIGLKPIRWKFDILVATSGVVLSPIAYHLLQPMYLSSALKGYEVIIISVILIIFVGFTEEIIFRGILQHVIENVSGLKGVLLVNALFAITYAGSLSWSYVLFMGIVGLFFSYCRRTGSLWGVVWAHSMISLGMLLIYYFQ